MLPALAEAMNGHARDPDGRERIPPSGGGPRCASATVAGEDGYCDGGGLGLAGQDGPLRAAAVPPRLLRGRLTRPRLLLPLLPPPGPRRPRRVPRPCAAPPPPTVLKRPRASGASLPDWSRALASALARWPAWHQSLWWVHDSAHCRDQRELPWTYRIKGRC